MRLTIVDIINIKLHNFKYLNFTIIFYIVFFYTYYTLFVYLQNKNYVMLLLYFIFFILVYSFYKNFTYIIGFVILIIFRIFNIDTMVNNKLIEGNEFSSIMKSIEKESNEKGDNMKKNAERNKGKQPNNPCKSDIINRVQEAGLTISNNTYNPQNKKESTASKMNSMLSGHNTLVAPTIYRL